LHPKTLIGVGVSGWRFSVLPVNYKESDFSILLVVSTQLYPKSFIYLLTAGSCCRALLACKAGNAVLLACSNPCTAGKRGLKRGYKGCKWEAQISNVQLHLLFRAPLQKSPHLCALCAHKWKEKGDVDTVGSSVSYCVCLHINVQYKFVNTAV